jgi:hypothetical protein
MQSQSGSPELLAAARPGISSAPERILKPEDFAPRHSNGLDQFFSYIKGESGLSILDLAGVNQANVSFITNLGHKIYSEDFLRGLRLAENGAEAQPRADAFLSQNLAHQEASFDGVLVWDALEYLSTPLLTATVDRLWRIVKPGSYLFAVFQAQEKAEAVLQYSFRIQDSKTLLVADRGPRQAEQVFNNRSLEKLFQNFESLKFFLARDKLREVIVRR